MYFYNLKPLRNIPTVKCWKCFDDYMFVLWQHSRDDFDNFIIFTNSIDPSKEITNEYILYLLRVAKNFQISHHHFMSYQNKLLAFPISSTTLCWNLKHELSAY